jgi:copper homeostasis protein
MPGSGINPETVAEILRALLPYGLQEIHLSGGGWHDGASQHRPDGFGMGTGHLATEWALWKTDASIVQRVREIADKVSREYKDHPWSAK